MRLAIHPSVLLLLLGWSTLAVGQDATRNFVLTRTYQVPMTQGATPVSVGEAALSLEYLDGLGRTQQQIQVQAGTNGKDLVTSLEYDALGRPVRTYLPVPSLSRSGAFQPAPATLANGYYYNSEVQRFADFSPRPFAETQYEASPLSRPTAQFSAGTDQPVRSQYGTNGPTDVSRFQAGASLTAITRSGYYEPNQLTSVTQQDEAGYQTVDYKDKDGRLVLRRTGQTQRLDTYYVYDELGQLRAVLQPNYQSSLDLTLHAFLYRYNGRGLLVEQQIPGGGNSSMVYDSRDRLISRTDGRNQKFYYQYDGLNRLTHMGICTGSCDEADASNTSNKTLLRQTFYDDYESVLPPLVGQSVGQKLGDELFFLRDASTYGWTTDTDFVPTDPRANRRGQITGSCARLLKADSTFSAEWNCHANYYDDRYRLVQTVRRLPQMGSQARERISYRYDFGGKLLAQQTQQSTSTQRYGLAHTYRYDASGRLLSTRLKATSSDGTLNKEVVLSAQQYNEIGLLVGKAIGAKDEAGSGAVERQRYRYWVRGWLQQQQATQRSFGLSYTYQANGNVGSLAYQYPAAGGDSYGFAYDEWNRMSSGRVSGGAGEALTYDNNGNIKTLSRYNPGGATIDQLSYSYEGGSGNRLLKVTDAAPAAGGFDNGASGENTDYRYDGAGNLSEDKNRGATLAYNCLNLPRRVVMGEQMLEYVYDAEGQKQTLSVGGVPTYYQGGLEYDGSMNLIRLATAEGQLVKQNNAWQWQYYLSDGQGNVRMVLDSAGRSLYENQYYPFGLSYAPGAGTGPQQGNRYQFLGKESQPQTGYVDLQARHYDPQLGRFVTVDPVTDGQEALTPYQYGWNSPLNKSDPTGRCPDCYDDPFIIGKLLTTAFYDTKHAIANTFFRSIGSNTRATYKEVDGRQIFETQYSQGPRISTLAGAAKEILNAGLDLAVVASAGSSGGSPTGGLFSRSGTGNQAARATRTAIESVDGYAVGTYKTLTDANLNDSHHVIQNAAVRDLPNYSRNDASAVQLSGPSNRVGTPHYKATQAQRTGPSGTYGAERNVAYKALRAAGISAATATQIIKRTDEYFKNLGVTLTTPTRTPGNRSR